MFPGLEALCQWTHVAGCLSDSLALLDIDLLLFVDTERLLKEDPEPGYRAGEHKVKLMATI